MEYLSVGDKIFLLIGYFAPFFMLIAVIHQLSDIAATLRRIENQRERQ